MVPRACFVCCGSRHFKSSIEILSVDIFQLLEENSAEHSRWEHDLLILRQALQSSATRDMQYGLGRSAETLSIEAELSQVQQKAAELHRKRADLTQNIAELAQKQDLLGIDSGGQRWSTRQSGVSGSKDAREWKGGGDLESSDRNMSTLYGSMLNDDNHGQQRRVSNGSFYINHDDDDLGQGQAGPALSGGGAQLEVGGDSTTLGDISEADDRIKKFYGIPPKENNGKEVKTVRMIKRDSKEKNLGPKSADGEDLGDEDGGPWGDLSKAGSEEHFLCPKATTQGGNLALSYSNNGSHSNSLSSVASSGSAPRTTIVLGDHVRRRSKVRIV